MGDAQTPAMNDPSDYSALESAVNETLERNGEAGKLRALLRASIFRILEGVQPDGGSPAAQPPEVSNLVALANEVVREYLHGQGYEQSASVFAAETGVAAPAGDGPPEACRAFLEEALGVRTDSVGKTVPLLLCVLNLLVEAKEENVLRCKAASARVKEEGALGPAPEQGSEGPSGLPTPIQYQG